MEMMLLLKFILLILMQTLSKTVAVKKKKQCMQFSPFLSLSLKMMEDADQVLVSSVSDRILFKLSRRCVSLCSRCSSQIGL